MSYHHDSEGADFITKLQRHFKEHKEAYYCAALILLPFVALLLLVELVSLPILRFLGTLVHSFFFSLVIGFFAAWIIFGVLHICWLNSYMEREVKPEFRERFCNTIIVCLLVLCTLFTFFGCFGEVVGKTWDNMDIGIRNDELTSVEKPKEQSTAHETSRATSSSSKVTHSDASSTSSNTSRPYSPPSPSNSTYPSTDNEAKYNYGSSSMRASSRVWEPGDAEKAFDSQIGHVGRKKLQQTQSEKKYGSSTSSSGYKASAVSDYISSYRPHNSSHSGYHSPISSGTSTAAATQAQAAHQSPPAAERVTDYDCECAEGSAPKDFWITEEDDTTHNSSCARYDEGEGMYSAQGSGTDCPDCNGAHTISQKTEVSSAPTSHEACHATLPTSSEVASTIPIASELDSFAEGSVIPLQKIQAHINGEANNAWERIPPRSSLTADKAFATSPNLPKPRPDFSRHYVHHRGEYWITADDDETHNEACSRYGEGDGSYSDEGSGTDCDECGGAGDDTFGSSSVDANDVSDEEEAEWADDSEDDESEEEEEDF